MLPFVTEKIKIATHQHVFMLHTIADYALSIRSPNISEVGKYRSAKTNGHRLSLMSSIEYIHTETKMPLVGDHHAC